MTLHRYPILGWERVCSSGDNCDEHCMLFCNGVLHVGEDTFDTFVIDFIELGRELCL